MTAPNPALPGVETHQPCVRCSYDLHGLPHTGNCPECGLPVDRSLRGDLLQFSDDAYRATLLRGVTLIMTGIVVTLCLTILIVGLSFVAPQSGLRALGALVSVVGTAVSLCGYYYFSAPDPGQFAANKGENPRKVIRVAIAVTIAASLGQFAVSVVSAITPAATPNSPQFDVSTGLDGLTLLAYALGGIAGIVQFFAAMMYTKWLAPRIPSPKVFKRAKLLMWLGPVLYVFGCGIGHLVALVLYYNMFSWIRKALITIRDEGEYFDDPSQILN